MKNYEVFTLALGNFGGNILRQQCYCNHSTAHVHIYFEINGISGASTTSVAAATIPTKYKPKVDRYGLGIIRNTSNQQIVGCIMLRATGEITQNITNSDFNSVTGVVDYYI